MRDKDKRINFINFVMEMEGKLFLVQFMKWGVSYCFFFGFVVQCFNEGGDLCFCILVLFVEYGVYKLYLKKIQSEVNKEFFFKWRIFEIECFK